MDSNDDSNQPSLEGEDQSASKGGLDEHFLADRSHYDLRHCSCRRRHFIQQRSG